MAADDVYDNIKARVALAPATARLNGSVNGAAVDRKEGRVFFRSAMFVVNAGTVTDGTHTVNVQESGNGSVWTDVDADDLMGTEVVVGTANDDQVHEIGYRGNARYIRLQLVTAGATTGGLIDAVCLLGIQDVPR
ncbi:hypothetical protein [Nonomuraea sp. NPDC050786]|uniref:hypothetical protein n=1 Tax=Nonomuraea sp. NPDC050786 TaxID=3154840 RepID=UPI003408013E